MMKRKTRVLLSCAAGLLALTLTLWYGSSVRMEADRAQREALAAYGEDLVTVYVASRDIAPGEVVDETNVQAEDWIATLLPEGAAKSAAEVMGERVESTIPARAVVTPAYFKEDDSSIEVPAGKVAVSVPADEERAVGGALEPGDLVAVYVSDGAAADLLCEAMVIATSDGVHDADLENFAWVTLAVGPDSVSEVLAATAKGTISLVLPGASGTDESAPESERDGVEKGQEKVGTGAESGDVPAAG